MTTDLSATGVHASTGSSRRAHDLVLFDFGGVILRTPFELLPEDLSWRGPFGPPGHDQLWDQSVADGGITEREYWRRRARQLHPDADDPTFTLMRELYDTDEDHLVRPELVALVERIRVSGLGVAVLTNDLRAFHGDAWVERITVLDLLDPVIDLSHAGFLKPAGQAFAHALARLDVPADRILFVDDQPPNVDGALDAGIDAVWFDPTDVAGSVARVEERLGVSRSSAQRVAG